MNTLTQTSFKTPRLHTRMLNAGLWLLGGNLSSQALRLASNLVLTRLLAPEAFGLIAAVNTLYFALVMFSDLGIWQSVVKRQYSLDDGFLSTAWLIQAGRGVLMALCILLIALGLHIAVAAHMFAENSVYSDPQLPAMVSAFALCAIVQGLESIKLATAQRELQGALLARLELSAQLGGTLITIGLAYATHSVWALLIGTFSGGLIKTVASHWLLPGPPFKLQWDTTSAREIVNFGKWMFLSSIIGFLAAHGEKLILCAYLGAASFGIYTLAITLLGVITGLYSTLNGRVIFSSLNLALQSDDHHEVMRVYTRVQQIADLCLGLLAGILITMSPKIIALMYDSRYQQAGWMLQCLSLSLLAMRHQVVEQLMFARSEPAWVSGNNLLRAALLGLLVPLGFQVGAEKGAVIGVVISQFASWPLSLWFKSRQGLLSFATEIWWIPALLFGICTGYVLCSIFGA